MEELSMPSSTYTFPGDTGPIWEVGYEGIDGELVDLNSTYTCELVVIRNGLI